MKNNILLIISLLIVNLSFTQTSNDTITITTSGTGKNLEEAKNNALRSAIEQAFGAFVSSNTEILNDNIIKDEINTISSGNIISFKSIIEKKLPNELWFTTLNSIVSIKNLQSYTISKGYKTEFSGSLFGFKIKQQKLNETAEQIAIKNLIKECWPILKESIDFTLKTNDPVISKTSNKPDDYDIDIEITCTLNDNITLFNELFFETLINIDMKKNELEEYNKMNKNVYPIVIQNLIKNLSGKMNLRSYETFELLKEFFLKTNSILSDFKLVTNLDTINIKNLFIEQDRNLNLNLEKHKRLYNYTMSFPDFYIHLPAGEARDYPLNYILNGFREGMSKNEFKNFLDSDDFSKTKEIKLDHYAEDTEVRYNLSDYLIYAINFKGDQYFHTYKYTRNIKEIEKLNVIEIHK